MGDSDLLRFVFWALLCVERALLFAYGRGFLGSFSSKRASRRACEPAQRRQAGAAQRRAGACARAGRHAGRDGGRKRERKRGRGRGAGRAGAACRRGREPPWPASRPMPSPRREARRFETRLARLDLGTRQTAADGALPGNHPATWSTSRRKAARKAPTAAPPNCASAASPILS